MFRKAFGVAALLALFAGPASAQQQIMVDIGGFGGLFLPVTDILELDPALIAPFTEAQAKHKPAVMFGGNVTVWVTDVFGIEGGFAYALSDGEITADGQDVCDDPDLGPCDANVYMGSVKGLYRFLPQPGGIIAIHLGAGVALIGRGGDVWEGVDGKTDIGGVVNVGATFDVAPQVAIRLDVQDYVYSAKFSDSETGTDLGDSKFQNDLAFTGGVVVKLGR